MLRKQRAPTIQLSMQLPSNALPYCFPERQGRWRGFQILAAGPGGGVLDKPTTKGLPGIDLG